MGKITSKISFEKVIEENIIMVISLGTKKENRGYFTEMRVDRNTVPKDWYVYDIRTDDDGKGIFCTLEKQVIINHGGTFLTQKEIKLKHSKPGICNDYFCLDNRNKYGFVFVN